MAVTQRETPPQTPPTEGMSGNSRVVLYNVTWEEYTGIGNLLGDRHPSLHMTYLEGVLELMTTGRKHEVRKTTIGRLLELYALEKGISLNGYGMATNRKKEAERGLEPDECYVLGRVLEEGRMDDPPDIAIEVDIGSSTVDKLEVYRGLGVREVWAWKKGTIVVFRLTGGQYEERDRSEFLPDLDLAQLARHAENSDQTAAARAFRDWLGVRG